MGMTSNRPYLIRAIYDWIVDNAFTPYLLVNAEYLGVEVPQEFVTAGRIVLNISPNACRGLLLENHRILFTARFGGIATQVTLSPGAVLAIYAKENGRGMEFDEPYDEEPPTPPLDAATKPGSRAKPVLKLVRK